MINGPFGEDGNGDGDQTSWQQYRRLVISEFERLNKAIGQLIDKIDRQNEMTNGKLETLTDNINKQITDMKVRIATVETKLAMIGLASGGLGAGIVELIRSMAAK